MNVSNSTEAIVHLNKAARKVQEKETTITTIITDEHIMWCPRADHIAVTAMRWTLRKLNRLLGEQYFKIEAQGMFLVVEIQNTQFKVGQQTWTFGNGDTSPEKKQPGLNRHTVAVIDGHYFHYVIHNGTLYTSPLHCLVGDR